MVILFLYKKWNTGEEGKAMGISLDILDVWKEVGRKKAVCFQNLKPVWIQNCSYIVSTN